MSELASYIDHTLLKPDATRAQLNNCAQSRRASILHRLRQRQPRGARLFFWKTATCRCAPWSVSHSAQWTPMPSATRPKPPLIRRQRVDMVMNVGRFMDGEHEYIVREIRDVVEAADDRVVKVILETCLLTNDEIAQPQTRDPGAGALCEDLHGLRQRRRHTGACKADARNGRPICRRQSRRRCAQRRRCAGYDQAGATASAPATASPSSPANRPTAPISGPSRTAVLSYLNNAVGFSVLTPWPNGFKVSMPNVRH